MYKSFRSWLQEEGLQKLLQGGFFSEWAVPKIRIHRTITATSCNLIPLTLDIPQSETEIECSSLGCAVRRTLNTSGDVVVRGRYHDDGFAGIHSPLGGRPG